MVRWFIHPESSLAASYSGETTGYSATEKEREGLLNQSLVGSESEQEESAIKSTVQRQPFGSGKTTKRAKINEQHIERKRGDCREREGQKFRTC